METRRNSFESGNPGNLDFPYIIRKVGVRSTVNEDNCIPRHGSGNTQH